MISKTSTMNGRLFPKLQACQQTKADKLYNEYDDEFVCQNLKKANLAVANNFGEVVKKFKSTFLNN